jgi:hypothetical protein
MLSPTFIEMTDEGETKLPGVSFPGKPELDFQPVETMEKVHRMRSNGVDIWRGRCCNSFGTSSANKCAFVLLSAGRSRNTEEILVPNTAFTIARTGRE